MSVEAITEIAAAEGNSALTCMTELFGDTFVSELAAAIAACLDGDLVKTLILDCLTNPDTSPLTKQMFAEIFQGVDLDEDGVIGRITDPAPDENTPLTSEGVAILTISKSRAAKVAVEAPVRARG